MWDVGRAPCRAHGTPKQRAVAAAGEETGLPPKDIRGVARWVIERVARGDLAPAEAQAINTANRILTQLDPEGEEEELALRKAVVHGRALHGLPPETPEQWALAEQMFDAEGMAELRRWQLVMEHNLRLVSGDGARE